MDIKRRAINEHFEIIIRGENGKQVERTVLKGGEMIYRESFANPTAWAMGGGNPVLDLFEKRFLHRPEKREDICQYRCNISRGSKGVRRILSKFLHLQIKLVNILYKNSFSGRKAADP